MKNARPLPIVVTPEPDCLADWKQEEPLIERLPGLVRRLVDDFLAADKRAEELADQLEKALQHKEEAEREREWQPIETAPLDGTKIDVWAERESKVPLRTPNAYFHDGRWLHSFNGMRIWHEPTHWRPIPKGPEQRP